jgi:hypothetical protein
MALPGELASRAHSATAAPIFDGTIGAVAPSRAVNLGGGASWGVATVVGDIALALSRDRLIAPSRARQALRCAGRRGVRARRAHGAVGHSRLRLGISYRAGGALKGVLPGARVRTRLAGFASRRPYLICDLTVRTEDTPSHFIAGGVLAWGTRRTISSSLGRLSGTRHTLTAR